MNNNIPKIIHQIWLQGENNLSDENKIKINQTKKLHPQWIYILWDEIKILKLIGDDKEIITKYYKFIYLHQKVDFSKFVILNNFGGIYLDMDCNVIKNLNLLFDKCSDYDMTISLINNNISWLSNYLTCNSFNTCVNNGIIISKKSTDICDYLIENFQTDCGYLQSKLLCIQNTTGPPIFNTLINNYINDVNNKNKSKILFLPYEYLEPCIGENCDIGTNTYVVHKHDLSWLGDNEKKIMNYYLINEIYISNIFVIFVIIIIIVILFFYIKVPC